MKNLIYLTILVFGLFTSSCNKEDDLVSEGKDSWYYNPDGELCTFIENTDDWNNQGFYETCEECELNNTINPDFANCSGINSNNSAGSMDNSFMSSLPPFLIYCSAIQSDGKILIGGKLGENGYAGILRLNSDGTVDNSFTSNAAQVFRKHHTVYAIELQDDGKILVGGQVGYPDGFGNPRLNAINRLNSDGTIDNTFNVGEGPELDPGNINTRACITAIAVQPDGKILIGGNYSMFNNQNMGWRKTLRLLPNGTLDNSYVSDIGNHPMPSVIRLQQDGRIIIAGGHVNGFDGSSQGIMRVNSNGSLDNTFNNQIANGSPRPEISGLEILPNGNMIVVVKRPLMNVPTILNYSNVMRLDANGNRDNSFNLKANVDNDGLNALAIQPDGKIIIAGKFSNFDENASHQSSSIARLTTEGHFDQSFVSKATHNANMRTLEITNNNKLIIGGTFSYDGISEQKRVIRIFLD